MSRASSHARSIASLARAALAVLTILLALPANAQSPSAGAGNYSAREDVRRFIEDMADRHGFVPRELQELFRRARFQPGIIRAMTPPPEAPQRSWQAYRGMFVSPQRIEAGLRFWQEHAAALARVAGEFGVPPEIVVAIIGVETVYGRNTGTHRVIDALSTLAFDFPRRADYFRSELEHYLLYAREAGVDLLSVKGSYAGAIGIPQFMPHSYRRYAVDFDGDGKRDLSGSPVDAIGSVANFLKGHGWRTGEPIAAPARVDGDSYRTLAESGVKPKYRVADLASFGVAFADGRSAPDDLPATLVELVTPGQPAEYWIGHENFYVITRYNRSSFYAISVLELAREIATRR